MKYWVYVSYPNNKARLHKESCRAIKVHGGTGTGKWNEFDALEKAEEFLKNQPQKDKQRCGLCKP